MPLMNCFCLMKKIRMLGIVTKTTAANSIVYSTLNCSCNTVSPNCTVRKSRVLVKTSGLNKPFHLAINVNRNSVASAGRDSGDGPHSAGINLRYIFQFQISHRLVLG